MNTAFTLVAILLLLALPHQQVRDRDRAIVRAWNECAGSIDRENNLLGELQRSLQLNPPWRVVDAREPEKRAKLIDEIIAEHQKRIELLGRIKKADTP